MIKKNDIKRIKKHIESLSYKWPLTPLPVKRAKWEFLNDKKE